MRLFFFLLLLLLASPLVMAQDHKSMCSSAKQCLNLDIKGCSAEDKKPSRKIKYNQEFCAPFHELKKRGVPLETEISKEIYTRLDAEWKWMKLTLEASAVDQDTAFGGKISDIHTPLSDTEKHFLEDESTIQYTELKASLLVSPFDFFWTQVGYSFYLGAYKGSRLEGSIGLTW